MENGNLAKIIALTTAILGMVMLASAQDLKQVPYYINLNEVDGIRVHEISDQTLNLTYHDHYGKWKEGSLKMYNWKREPVATLRLDKSYGLNSYSIKLDQVYNAWEIDQIYSAEFKDESGRLYRLSVRIVAPPDKQDPFVDILTNPLQVSCSGLEQNLIEFYGNISGGKPPYTVKWFVLNNNRKDFLYQPREEFIRSEGKTSKIIVDVMPEYYVVLFVKDACGNIQKRIVNLVCDDEQKKINTIFLQELENLPKDLYQSIK